MLLIKYETEINDIYFIHFNRYNINGKYTERSVMGDS